MPLPWDALFQEQVMQWLAYCAQRNISVLVVAGTGRGRTHAEQLAIYARSKTEGFAAATPGKSCHEVGAAGDFYCLQGYKSHQWAEAISALHWYGLRQPLPDTDPGHIENTLLCHALQAGVINPANKGPFPAPTGVDLPNSAVNPASGQGLRGLSTRRKRC